MIPVTTALFVPPPVCGCILSITAQWGEGTVREGLAYGHPHPLTVTDIGIVSMCETHGAIIKAETGPLEPSNIPGYIPLPIAEPTQAERLYVYLWRYHSILRKLDTCGSGVDKCSIYFVGDRISGEELAITEHPFSKVCSIHQDSKHSLVECHVHAHKENAARMSAHIHIAETTPSMFHILTDQEKWMLKLMAAVGGRTRLDLPDKVLHPDKEVTSTFDENRKLIITMHGFTDDEKAAVDSTVKEKAALTAIEVA